MVASTEKGLQIITDRLSETAKTYDMKINVKKTKSMVMSRDIGRTMQIMVDGEQVEQVKQFKYLGTWLTEDCRSSVDVKCRIALAKVAFNSRKELFTSRLQMPLKKRIIKTVVWPVLLYGCETWSLRKEEIQRLEVCEMWIWRRITKTSWKDKKSNDEVLKLVGKRRCLVDTMLARKKNWISHVFQGEGLMLEAADKQKLF